MRVIITKKDVIVAAVCFLAGVIITTSGFLIFKVCAHNRQKRITPTYYSSSQNFDRHRMKDGNSNKQSKKNTGDSSKRQTSKSEGASATADGGDQ